MLERICNCGTCRDAWDAVLRDNVRSIEAGECLLWRAQIAAAMTMQCVEIAKAQFSHEEGGARKLTDQEARDLVGQVILEMTLATKALLPDAAKPLAKAYGVKHQEH